MYIKYKYIEYKIKKNVWVRNNNYFQKSVRRIRVYKRYYLSSSSINNIILKFNKKIKLRKISM